MASKTGSLEVAQLMEGSPGDVTAPKRQSEQSKTDASVQYSKELLALCRINESNY